MSNIRLVYQLWNQSFIRYFRKSNEKKTELELIQLFRITPDLRCQKRHWLSGFSATSIKFWSRLHILPDVLGVWWFVIGGFRSVLCVSKFVAFHDFRVRSRFFEKQSKICLSTIFLIFFSLKHGKNRSFLWSFQMQKKHRYGRVKTNRYVPSNINFNLQLLLVIATFIWQTQWMRPQ